LDNEIILEEKTQQLQSNIQEIKKLDILKYNYYNKAFQGVVRNGKATIFFESLV